MNKNKLYSFFSITSLLLLVGYIERQNMPIYELIDFLQQDFILFICLNFINFAQTQIIQFLNHIFKVKETNIK